MTNALDGKRGGFTLIELMIAVAIVAILAAIAYPSYRQQVLKSKRAEGKTLLQRIAGEQERFFTARSSYTDDLTGDKPDGLGFASDESERGCYVAAIQLTDGGMGYVLTAAPADSTGCGDQTQDERCGTLSIDNLGNKGSVDGTHPNECW